jgi:hypothetical protein
VHGVTRFFLKDKRRRSAGVSLSQLQERHAILYNKGENKDYH